ncbi:hypothetical protein D9757_011808 [Collybiopsis confluens]|uniref:Uncharacterized protein n=1 Tax=Collybiopsis confluens TaxID=2823264 RepID=A0A8H5GGK6_9AGAR|nr:hypothetical protein D9757_011808 [Collybiopsis confluens]
METFQEWRAPEFHSSAILDYNYSPRPSYLYTTQADVQSPRSRIKDRGQNVFDWIRWRYDDFETFSEEVSGGEGVTNLDLDAGGFFGSASRVNLQSDSSFWNSLHNGVVIESLNFEDGEELDSSFEAALNSILNICDDEEDEEEDLHLSKRFLLSQVGSPSPILHFRRAHDVTGKPIHHRLPNRIHPHNVSQAQRSTKMSARLPSTYKPTSLSTVVSSPLNGATCSSLRRCSSPSEIGQTVRPRPSFLARTRSSNSGSTSSPFTIRLTSTLDSPSLGQSSPKVMWGKNSRIGRT